MDIDFILCYYMSMNKMSIEKIHDDSVALVKGRCAKTFLPLLLCVVPVIVIEALTLGIALIFGGFIWVLFDVAMFTLARVQPSQGDETIDSTNGEKLKYSYFKNYYRNKDMPIKKAFAIALFKRLMIIGGLVLFVIPGIVMWLSLSLSSFIAADNPELNARETLIKCRDFTRHSRFQLLRAYIYCFLPALITIGTFGLLAPWTIPYIAAIKFHFYQALSDESLPEFDIKNCLKIGTNHSQSDNDAVH